MGFHPTNIMKELKNIDRLFQEKFRDFEQMPPDYIWKNISASLSGKNKNNNRILWLWFSGIAAGLAMLFLLNNPFTQTDNLDHSTTDTNDTAIIKTEPSNSEVTYTNTENTVNDKIDNTTNTSNQKENNYRNNTTLSKTVTNKNQKSTSINLQNDVVNNTNTIKSSSKTSTPLTDKITPVNNKIASNESVNSAKEKGLNTNNNIKTISKEINKKQNIQTQEKNKEITTKNNQAIASNTTEDKSKISLNEIVSKNTKDNDDFIANTSSKKWTISTTIAPVYFDAFDGNTSSFGERFDKNTKQGQFSTAYGVQLAYQVNKRFSVQTGFHKVDYGYKTNEVYVSLNQFADNRKSSIGLNDIVNIKDFHAPPNQNGEVKEVSSGSLMQVFGYYEIPVEMKYQLVKGKLGIDVVSGFSTLIRAKDEVYYQFDDFSEKIDETSNLSAINLTGNIGLEANYKISKNVSFNITPMFKVHTNTFTKDAGKSNPYALGVYSGLNYRF